jgi:HSP20 family protein
MLNQDSFRELANFSDRLNRALEGHGTLRGDRQESMALADWAPVVDVLETESEFLLVVELPGVDKTDVKVSVEAGVLTLAGNREQEKEAKGVWYHRVERAYGRFARTFTVPDLVDEERLTAEFRNGLLIVRLPKSEKAKPRSIDVRVS